MAAFTDDPGEFQRLDYRLLQNGPVALYLRPSILDDDVAWLAAEGWRIDRVDARAWRSSAEALAALAAALAFPEYFGKNLDALNDCLGDLDVPPESGRALVLAGFDAAVRRLGDFAPAVLDVFAIASRRQLLHGRRLLALVQSDDPALALEPVGACPVTWNPREWLDSARRA